MDRAVVQRVDLLLCSAHITTVSLHCLCALAVDDRAALILANLV